MKTLIKQYQTPRVDMNILKIILEKQEKKNYISKVFGYIILTMIFMIFIKQLIELNISYANIFISLLGNVNIFIILFINLTIGIIYFIINNFFLIFGAFFMYYISRLFDYRRV